MESPSAVQDIATEFDAELQWLFGTVDAALRDSAALFSPRGRTPAGHVISMLMREDLGHLAGAHSPLRAGETRSRLALESRGQDWITVSLAGLGSVRLRKRPAKVAPLQPVLAVAGDGQPALFDTPDGVLVMFWGWDGRTGMLQSLWLSQITTLDYGSTGPVVHDEVEINFVAVASSGPAGAGRDEDDLEGLVSRWDHSEDSQDPAGAPDMDTDRDEDQDDEGDSIVGDAG